MYRHTQRFGTLPGVAVIVGLVLAAISTVFAPLFVVVFIPLLWIAWTFSMLTVQVGAETVEWFFRGGFWRVRLRLADIVEATPVQNRWWYGWGIRRTPHGWLYNVRGLSAVEFRTRSGRRVRVGSDEPEALAAEIARRLRGHG